MFAPSMMLTVSPLGDEPFGSVPTLPESYEPFSGAHGRTELLFVAVCLVVIVLGLSAFISTSRRLRSGDNPARDRIAGFFRTAGAVSAEHTIPKKELPSWMTGNASDSITFQAMEQKKILKKVKRAYYLDEDALARLLGGQK